MKKCNKKYVYKFFYIVALLFFECSASDYDSFDGLHEEKIVFAIENLPHTAVDTSDLAKNELIEEAQYPYKNHREETASNPSSLKKDNCSVETTGSQEASKKMNQHEHAVAFSSHGSCSPPHNSSTKTYTLSLSGSECSKKSIHVNQSCLSYEEYGSRGKEHFKDVVERVLEEQESKAVSVEVEEKKDDNSKVVESTRQKEESIKSSTVVAASAETEEDKVQQQGSLQQEVKESGDNSFCSAICSWFSCC